MLFLVIAIHLIIDCPLMSSGADGVRDHLIFHAVTAVCGRTSIFKHDRCSGEPYNFTKAKIVIIQILKI